MDSSTKVLFGAYPIIIVIVLRILVEYTGRLGRLITIKSITEIGKRHRQKSKLERIRYSGSWKTVKLVCVFFVLFCLFFLPAWFWC